MSENAGLTRVTLTVGPRFGVLALTRRKDQILTVHQKLEITRKRTTLQTSIERCEAKAPTFLGEDAPDPAVQPNPDPDNGPDDDPEENWRDDPDDNQEENRVDPWDEPGAQDIFLDDNAAWEDQLAPEKASLTLPSSLGMAECRRRGITEVAKKELELRIGQANDALHKIRTMVGGKSMLFRTQVRGNQSQNYTGRAWTRVHDADAKLREYGRVYTKCRAAMIALGGSVDLLARYQVLTPDQVKAKTAYLDPGMRGERNTQLPWFWWLGAQEDMADEGWMRHCESVHSPAGVSG